MKAKAIIFDLNGTMINDFDSHCYACSHLAKDYFNKEISPKELKSNIIGKTNEMVIKSLADKPLSQEEINYYINIKEQLYLGHIQHNNNLKLRDGTKLLLSYLKLKNIPYTIVATSSKEVVEKILNQLELQEYISIDNVIYDNSNYQNKKCMYEEASNKLNHDIKDIIVLEDSIPGIQAAIDSGCNRIVALYHKALHQYYGNYHEVRMVTTSFIDLIFQLEAKDVF